jgi:L-alanine-DL-glutamate epimerase-like enolase superfamily enzyme
MDRRLRDADVRRVRRLGSEDIVEIRPLLEEYGFYWYEEPMREFDLTSYGKLANSLDIPVLAAETSDGVHWNAATWIDMSALEMVRASSFYKGGLTGALKIAHLRGARNEGPGAWHGRCERASGGSHMQQRLL